MRPKNEFMSMRFLFIFITVAILANTLVFLLAFLRMSDTWQSAVKVLSILTPNNLSQSLFSIEIYPIFLFFNNH